MATMEKVTLTLPRDLMNLVRETAPPRGYSKFIADAIEFFIEAQRRQERRARLIIGYQANASADAALAADWAAVEDETWLTHVPAYEGEEPLHDAVNPTR